MFKIDVSIFKPHDGENKVRPIPRTTDEMDYWALPIHVHYGVGPEEQAYLCPRKHGGKKCPVCEEFDRAKRAGKEEDAKQLRPNGRYLLYLVDRKDKEKGIQVWSMPYTLDAELAKQTVDPESGETLNIDDPEAGYDVYFTREGKGDRTKYSGVKLARKESSLDDDKALRFAQKHPLTEILQVYDYEHILKEFEGSVARKESDEDEDEEADDRAKKRRGQRRDPDEEEDDEEIPYESEDEEDEDDSDDDSEDEGSDRKSRKRSSRRRDEDADEDEDDKDDDDDEDEEGGDEEEDDEDEDQPRSRKKPHRRAEEDEEDEEEDEDDDESGDESPRSKPSAKSLRAADLATLKKLADQHLGTWKKLRVMAKEQGWDDTKLKIRLRRKVAEALGIDLT
jgi:hypothetical protein